MDVSKIIGKFVGNKSDRDMREVTPFVDKIRQSSETIEGLSNDELRERSVALKKRVAAHVQGEKDTLEELKTKAEDLMLSIDTVITMLQNLFNKSNRDNLSETLQHISNSFAKC